MKYATLLCMLLVFPLTAGAKNLFEGLESMILSGNLDAAHEQVEQMFRTHSIVTSPAIKSVKDYEKIVNALQAAENLETAYNNFSESTRTREEFEAFELSYSSYRSAWSKMSGSLRVSQKMVDHVNGINASVTKRYRDAETAREEAQVAESERLEKQREREEQERERKEQERRAKYEAEQQAQIEREAAEERARQEKLSALDLAARDAGFNGLNMNYGVARFLYNASKEGTLADGIEQVFWTNLSAREARLDSKFKLSQVVDGWEIYELSEWSGDELVRLSIAIPGSRLPMEGQQLRKGFYVFQGNMEFVTVTGGKRIVQKFSRVNLQ